MTLTIRDTLLAIPPVGQRVYDAAQIPFIVRFMLEELDPHVRYSHGETVVKPDTALLDRNAKQGHARDILRNGNRGREQFVHCIVGLQKNRR